MQCLRQLHLQQQVNGWLAVLVGEFRNYDHPADGFVIARTFPE